MPCVNRNYSFFIHWLARLEPNVFRHGEFISGISYVQYLRLRLLQYIRNLTHWIENKLCMSMTFPNRHAQPWRQNYQLVLDSSRNTQPVQTDDSIRCVVAGPQAVDQSVGISWLSDVQLDSAIRR